MPLFRRKNIMFQPDAVKHEVYDQIEERYRQGKPVTMAEHKDGFLAVTVDCGNIHILTDRLSLEDWREKANGNHTGAI